METPPKPKRVVIDVSEKTSVTRVDGKNKTFQGNREQLNLAHYLTREVGSKTAEIVNRVIQIWRSD